MTTLIENKKARLRFEVLETYQAGLELAGYEVKSIRSKLGSLDGSRVIVRGAEAFIVGMTVPPFQIANTPKTYDPERPRRLLLTRKEIGEYLAATPAAVTRGFAALERFGVIRCRNSHHVKVLKRPAFEQVAAGLPLGPQDNVLT